MPSSFGSKLDAVFLTNFGSSYRMPAIPQALDIHLRYDYIAGFRISKMLTELKRILFLLK